jgi:FkbM family methyltransferase
MNWKLKAGKLKWLIEQKLIKINSRFIHNNYPYGRDWIFDVKRILKNVSVIVDGGANVGDISLALNGWFSGVDIYAFEPVSDTFQILSKNTAPIKGIHAVQMALGSKNEKATILLNKENTINSLKVTEVNDQIGLSETISIIRLDTFLEMKNLTHIDILKIDVEGFEFEVLDGCGSIINTGISCIYLEVGYQREQTKVHFSDVETYMEDHGFELIGIYETRRSFIDRRRLWYSNNLYIKKDLLHK